MKKLILTFLSAFIFIQFVSAQITITGKVTNKKTKSPIEGAAITVPGYKMPSIITDASGTYTINVPEGAKTLVVSYTGMKPITIEIGSKKKINFKMTADVYKNNVNKKESNKKIEK